MERHERVVEHVISHLSAESNTRRLVERPVDAQVNSALAVFFFCLRERRETARKERTHVAIVISRDSVQFVGYEGEGDVVRFIKSAQRLEESASEAGVTGGIGRERRRKVWSGEVAGRRTQRRPGR